MLSSSRARTVLKLQQPRFGILFGALSVIVSRNVSAWKSMMPRGAYPERGLLDYGIKLGGGKSYCQDALAYCLPFWESASPRQLAIPRLWCPLFLELRWDSCPS